MAEELHPDIFIVSEHSFTSDNVELFRINNYKLANIFLRTHFKGGGVAILVQSRLLFRPFTVDYCCDLHFEVAGIKIDLNFGKKITIIGLYRSPNGCSNTFFEKFESLLNFLHSKSLKFVITGDFNINVLDHTDPLTQRLRDILISFGLVWSVNTPTRVTATSKKAIDNVITNMTDASVSVLNAAISDHFAQETVINQNTPIIKPSQSKIKRDQNSENITLLNRLLKNESWSFLDNFIPADEVFTAFYDHLIFNLDIACPLKIFKERKQKHTNTWVTQNILNMRQRLKFFHSIYLKTENEHFKQFFKNFKRDYRKEIKAAKKRDIEKQLKNSENFSKTAWKIIKDLSSQSKNSNPVKLNVDNKLIEEPLRVASEFNTFFSSVAVLNAPLKDQNHREVPLMGPVSSMVLSPVSESEVERVIQGLKAKRSCDINGMSVWLLKRCYKHMLTPLTKLINESFAQGIFPSKLKTAKVIPIFKKDDPCLASNYRPISILPVLSKIFEKVFLIRFEKFLQRFEILCPEQFGFRKNKSTVDAVTDLIESVVDGLERREHVLSIFLDLSKAFDCVHHETLLHQLETCGVRGLPHDWLSSYLRGRDQCVQIENTLSDKITMAYGVPQGSILGPVLFLIYVNRLSSSIQNGKVVQYADDTTLCIRSKTKRELEIQSFLKLNSCMQYFSEINLRVNSAKSIVVSFCLRQTEHDYLPVVMADDALIDEAESTKFLGIHLDRGLTWEDHIDSVCSKVAKSIYVLRNLAKFCSLDVLRTAYFGLVHPHMSYGIRLWGSCSKHKFEKVFRTQKKAVRTILKLNFRESCKDAFRELGLLTLPCLYILEVALYCRFKCELVQGRDVHHYETRGRDNYRTERNRTAAHEHLPSRVGVKLINRLPEEIKELNDPKKFKSRLKHFLVDKALYSVDEFMMSRWD